MLMSFIPNEKRDTGYPLLSRRSSLLISCPNICPLRALARAIFSPPVQLYIGQESHLHSPRCHSSRLQRSCCLCWDPAVNFPPTTPSRQAGRVVLKDFLNQSPPWAKLRSTKQKSLSGSRCVFLASRSRGYSPREGRSWSQRCFISVAVRCFPLRGSSQRKGARRPRKCHRFEVFLMNPPCPAGC